MEAIPPLKPLSSVQRRPTDSRGDSPAAEAAHLPARRKAVDRSGTERSLSITHQTAQNGFHPSPTG
ncbi:hypothetical protein [Rossellomorea marisflavi]